MNLRPATLRLTSAALLLALCIVLSFVEGLLPEAPFLPPGVKLGLSNIVIMYCLFFIGSGQALLLAVLKSLFVLLTRGATAGLLSLSGGLISVGVLILLMKLCGKRISYMSLSMTGAVFHNLGQLLAVSLLLTSAVYVSYLPVLILSGAVMGAVNGLLLRAVLPALKRLDFVHTNCE